VRGAEAVNENIAIKPRPRNVYYPDGILIAGDLRAKIEVMREFLKPEACEKRKKEKRRWDFPIEGYNRRPR
jgi:hypothetical protein